MSRKGDKWKYECVKCGALYTAPQKYCRVCLSDVEEANHES